MLLLHMNVPKQLWEWCNFNCMKLFSLYPLLFLDVYVLFVNLLQEWINSTPMLLIVFSYGMHVLKKNMDVIIWIYIVLLYMLILLSLSRFCISLITIHQMSY